MTTNRLTRISSVVLAWSSIMIAQVALASQSKAQLYLPWPMLNTKLNTVLSGSNSNYSTKVAASTINADGIFWHITNIVYNGTTKKPVSHTNGSQLDFQADNSALKVTAEEISVDQIIEKVVNGATVRIHLQATCGPLTFTQPNASIASTFNIDWSTGSPTALLKSTALSWAQNSWVIQDFTCQGPEGLPQILKDQISERLKNADDFKPYLTEFLTSRVQTLVQDSLAKIRDPLTLQAGSSHQTFKVGKFFNVPQGLIADLTISTNSSDPILPPVGLPSPALLSSLSSTTPTMIAPKTLFEQIVRDELNSRPTTIKSDLQQNASFHALMQDRVKQTFGWSDLTKYDKNAPFPLTIFRPKFEGVTLTSDGKLRSTFALNGIVQSYRDGKWWSWLSIGGQATAEVQLTVANGTVKYATNMNPSAAVIDYASDYKVKYKKDSPPPADRMKEALTGPQSALSGTYQFPIINLTDIGSYKLSSMKWIDSNSFILNWISAN